MADKEKVTEEEAPEATDESTPSDEVVADSFSTEDGSKDNSDEKTADEISTADNDAAEDDDPEDPETDFTSDEIRLAIRRHNSSGHPEVSAILRQHLNDKTSPPQHLVIDANKVRAEKVIPKDLEVPPRFGPGASQEKWAKFANAVTDIEEEVVAKMGRDDIIHMLEVKKIITREEG